MITQIKETETEYLRDIDIQEVVFESAGAKLHGKLFLPKGLVTSAPVFVLACGIGGRKEWFEPYYPYEICKRNFALFTFDLRGHSPSEGKLDGNIGSDIPAAIEYIKTVQTIDPNFIILGGQCLGALMCNQYAAQHPDIRGIANISIFLPEELNEPFTRLANNMVMMQIRTSETHSADYDKNDFYNGYAKDLKVLSNFNQITPRPTLFIHYLTDPVCFATRVELFFNAIDNPNKELMIMDSEHETWISKVNHAMSYDDPKFAKGVGEWLEINFLRN